jgi:hypothetical protein
MTVDTIVTSIDQSAVNCCAANLQPREKLPVDTGRLQAASSSAFFRNQLPSNGPLRAVQLHAPPQTATQDSEHGGWPCLPSPGRSPQIRSRVRPLPAALIRGGGEWGRVLSLAGKCPSSPGRLSALLNLEGGSGIRMRTLPCFHATLARKRDAL